MSPRSAANLAVCRVQDLSTRFSAESLGGLVAPADREPSFVFAVRGAA